MLIFAIKIIEPIRNETTAVLHVVVQRLCILTKSKKPT